MSRTSETKLKNEKGESSNLIAIHGVCALSGHSQISPNFEKRDKIRHINQLVLFPFTRNRFLFDNLIVVPGLFRLI